MGDEHFSKGQEVEVSSDDVVFRKMRDVHFRRGQEVEVSSDDVGFRGAWYVATIIRLPLKSSPSKKKRKFLVEYESLIADEEGTKPLREYVDAWHIRPRPPRELNPVFDRNEEVDAFHNDGWWEGAISKVLENSRYVVYFRNSGEEMEFGLSELRVHLEWVDGRWTRPQVQQQQLGTTSLQFSFGTLVEVSLEDENCHGAWFPATVLRGIGNDSYMVEYQSLGLGDERRSLKETVDSSHIRPSPPQTSDNQNFHLLEKVDALYNFGWWSGVITKVLAGMRYNVYFKHWNEEKEFDLSKLRLHMDWIDGKWVHDSWEISITSHNPVGIKSIDKKQLGPANNTAQSSEMAIQLTSPGASDDAAEDTSPLCATNSSKKTTYSTHHSDAELSQPCKKLKKGEAAEASFSLISCSVRAISPGTVIEADAPNDSTPTLKDKNASRKIGTSQDLECSRSIDHPSVKGSSSHFLSESRRINLPPEIIEVERYNFAAPKSPVRWGRKQLARRPPRQMKVTMCGIVKPQKVEEVGKRAEMVLKIRGPPTKEKEIRPHIVERVGKQTKVLRKKGRPPKTKVAKTNDSMNGPEYKASRGEMTNEVVQTESVPKEVEMLATGVSSNISDDEQPLSLWLKVTGNEGVLPDQLVSQSNKAVTWDASVMDLELQKLCNMTKSSFSLEEFTSAHNQCDGARIEQNEILHFVDKHCNKIRGKPNEVFLQSPVIDPIRDKVSIGNGSLPFTKSSFMWEKVESMGIFCILPQNPHFRPLEQYNKEHREGMAIGHMVTFANLVGKICDLQLNNPRSDLEDISKALVDLELLGFNVQKVRVRLKELLRIKDEQGLLEEKADTVKGQIVEKNRDNDKFDEEIDEIDESLRELQQSINLLSKRRTSVVKNKEINGSNIATLQMTVDAVDRSIRHAGYDFDSIVATPW